MSAVTHILLLVLVVQQLWTSRALVTRTSSSGVVQLDRVNILCLETPVGSSSRVTIRAESATSGAAPVLLLRNNGLPSSTKFDSQYTIPLEHSALELSLTLDGPTPTYLGIWGGRVENSLRYFAGDPDVVYYSVSIETMEGEKAAKPISESKNGSATVELPCMTLQRDIYKVPPGNPSALSSSLAGATRISSTLLQPCQLSTAPLVLSLPDDAPGVLSMQSADAFLRNHWRARGDNDTVIDYTFRAENGSGAVSFPAATAAFLSGSLPSSVGKAMGGGVVQVQVWVRLARAVPGESTVALRQRLRRAMGGGLVVSLRAGGLAPRPSSSPSSPSSSSSSNKAAAATLVLHSSAATVVEIRDASTAGSRAGQGRLRAWSDEDEDEEDEEEEDEGEGEGSGGSSSALGALQALLGLVPPSPSPPAAPAAPAAPAPTSASVSAKAAAGRRKARSSSSSSSMSSNRSNRREVDDGVGGGVEEERDASGNEGLLLVWSVQSPPLHGPALSPLGITIVRDEASGPSTGRALGLDSGLIVSVGLVSQPCGGSSCSQRLGQGRCVVETSPSPRGVCVCRLPWGGADCSQLVQDKGAYARQLGLLVGSNAAIAPGVWVAAKQKRWAFAAVMLTSALSSALYHLCDMDAYCLPLGDPERTYAALQAFDITFSTLTVAAMILLHGPLGSSRATEGESHAALTVVMLGLLLPAVGADPTRVQNIVLAVVAAVVLCILSWLQSLVRAVREGRCCWGATTQKLDSNTSKAVALSEEVVVDGDQGEDDASEGEDGQGVEMSTIALSGDWNPAQVRASHHPASSASSSSAASRAGAAAAATTKAAVKAAGLAFGAARPLGWSLLGAFLAAAGIAAFALQTAAAERGGYYWAHSLWHVFVMLSGGPLLKGRSAFIAWLSLRLGIREV